MDPSRIIVKEVSKRPILWDGKDKQMYNKTTADSEWSDVAEKVGLTVETVKTKWKNLRDTFRRELKKLPKDVTTLDPKWQHFPNMLFLLDQMVDESTADSIRRAFSHRAADTITSNAVNSDSEDGEVRQRPVYDPGDSDSDYSTGEIPKLKSSVLKRALHQHNPTVEIEPKRSKVYDNFNDDEDMLFFKSLLPFMRELTTMQKLQIRNEIQGILIREISAQSTHAIKTDPAAQTNTVGYFSP